MAGPITGTKVKRTEDLGREEDRKEQTKLHWSRIIYRSGLLSDKLIEDVVEDALDKVRSNGQSEISVTELLVVEEAVLLNPNLMTSKHE